MPRSPLHITRLQTWMDPNLCWFLSVSLAACCTTYTLVCLSVTLTCDMCIFFTYENQNFTRNWICSHWILTCENKIISHLKWKCHIFINKCTCFYHIRPVISTCGNKTLATKSYLLLLPPVTEAVFKCEIKLMSHLAFFTNKTTFAWKRIQFHMWNCEKVTLSLHRLKMWRIIF